MKSHLQTSRINDSLPLARLGAVTVSLIMFVQISLQAKPGYRASCTDCHSQKTGRFELTGFPGTLDLGDGNLKHIQVAPGEVIPLNFNVLNAGSEYALSLFGFDRSGVQNPSNRLIMAADDSWRDRDDYFTTSTSSSEKAWTFDLGVAAETPPDYYRLEIQIGGDGGGLWAQREEFYVQVTGGGGGPVSTPLGLVASGAIWKFLDDGSDQGTAWRELDFDDSSWGSGPSQLGYGDDDEETEVGYGGSGSNKYITTYFRHEFQVEGSRAVESLNLRLLYDDGAAVYLNGQEVVRVNLEADAGFEVEALDSRGGDDEDAWENFTVDTAYLRPGFNVLAVEIHQSGAGSSDISMDLQLQARYQPVLFIAGGQIKTKTETGTQYHLEISNDLMSWSPATDPLGGDGTINGWNPDASTVNAAFYRLVIE